jgi:CRISPR-associated protein Cas2
MMVVYILERVPVSLRGELSRWTLEAKAGVFVGSLSALVRDLLWEKVCGSLKDGAAVLIHNSEGEQGFSMRYWGEPSRSIRDFEGLWLIGIKERQAQF